MSAMTVHRSLERVNTLCRVISDEGDALTPGARLKAYIRERWTRRMGGDVGLAQLAGIRRQTLQDWYAGKDTPSLGHLAAVAEALGVRRVDLVAAYDGVTAPEQQEAAAPDWARAVAQETAEDVVRRLVPPDLLGAAHRLLAELVEPPPPSDEAQPEEREAQDQVG